MRRNLARSGLKWDGKRVTRPATAVPEPYADRLSGREDVEKEVDRILESLERDPADAITASRALVETACKSVLEDLGQEVDDRDDLLTLYKKAAAALTIDPVQHAVVYRQTLQGLASSAHGLAELATPMDSGAAPSALSPDTHGWRLALR